MPIAAAKDLTDCSLFNRLVEGLLKPATELVLRQGWALLVLLPENDFLSIAESVPFRWDWSSEVRKYYDKFHYFLRAKNHGRSAQYSQKSLTICLLIDNVQQPVGLPHYSFAKTGHRPGSAVVRVEAANILSYSKDIYNGARSYPFPTPLVIGTDGIGRIAAFGPDATSLKLGQLVFIDWIHDGHTDGSKLLMRGEWRDATYVEFAKVSLENCYELDERVMTRLGYGIQELRDLSRSIDLKAGETIVIAPATGAFGSAAVKVALAMGARVVALGRNAEALQTLAESHDRVEAFQLTGDIEADTASIQSFGTINAFLDISPAEAAESTHFRSSILALGQGGRACFMGGIGGKDLAIPLRVMMTRDLVLRGKWMYSQQNVHELIKMIEVGVLKLGESGAEIQEFALEDWDKGFAAAAVRGAMCVLVP